MPATLAIHQVAYRGRDDRQPIENGETANLQRAGTTATKYKSDISQRTLAYGFSIP